jgi:hypothetical protein
MANADIKFDDDLMGYPKRATDTSLPAGKDRNGLYIFSPELLTTIIERIAQGGTLLRICEEDGMPNRQTFHEWLKKVDGARERYDAAVAHRTERYVEEITGISDDGYNDTYIDEKTGERKVIPDVVARSKLRVDSRKWIASKLIPHKYGEKVTTEVTGANGNPLIPENNDLDTARRVAFLLAQGVKSNE